MDDVEIEIYFIFGLLKKHLPIYGICAAIQTGIVYCCLIAVCGAAGRWAKR